MSKRDSIWVSFFALGLLVASVAHAQKEPEPSAAARQHFKAGVAYVEDPDGAKYDEALQEFRKAYAESPLPKIMNNIGLCALHLERDGEAIEAYEIYLKGNSADLTPQVRKQVEKDVAMLKSSLVKVSLFGEPKDVNIVDERRNSKGDMVVNRYKLKDGLASLGLHPGHHKLTASFPGYKSVEWEVDADPGASLQHVFKLSEDDAKAPVKVPVEAELKPVAVTATEPPKAPEHGTHAGVYVGGVATGVFAVAATVTGVMALGKKRDLDAANKIHDVNHADSLATAGKRLALFTDIEVGAAVLSAGVATYFYFRSPSKTPEQISSPVALRISPTVGPERVGMVLMGSF